MPFNLKKHLNKIICGDALTALKNFPANSIDSVVTSPPYFNLRDYDVEGQIGLETDFNEYLEKLLLVFDEIKRVLKPKGTCWIVIGDTYGGNSAGGNLFREKNERTSLLKKSTILSYNQSKYRKSLLQIPSRLSIAMIEHGWILRNEIIWHKPNAIPQSVKDRFSVDFEKVFFFVKSRHYYFRQQFEPLKNPDRLKRRLLNPNKSHKLIESYWTSANPNISEKRRRKMLASGRNKRCVWTIGTTNFSGQHFAVFPPRLIETPILAGCPKGGIILDPFIGSGTTAVVAQQLGRKHIGIELSGEYLKVAGKRIKSIKTSLKPTSHEHRN